MKRDQLFLIAFLFLGYSALTGSPATTSRPLTSPDLVITDVTVTDGNGPNIGFSITFKNQGADPTANYFLLKIYLSTDATISGSDHKIDQIAYAYYMDPDESFTYVKTNFPAHGVLTGSYYLGAIIDTDNWVPESNESNNSAYDSSVMLAMTAVPDLSLYSVDLVNVSGSTYRNYFDVSNPSLDPAHGTVTFSQYLSTDMTVTPADHLIYEETKIFTLYPGNSYSDGSNGFDSSTLSVPPGTYYMGVIIDKNDVLTETNESNNALCDDNPKVIVPATGLNNFDLNLPTYFDLLQNRPNPFNSETTIAYQLPREAEVRLTLYDIRGTRLLIHEPGKQPAGEHVFHWDSRDETGTPLPSGVYLCRFQAGKFNKTIRMLMMK